MYKKQYYLGFTFYACLLILSIVFYKERTVFLDIAFHLFAIITEGDLAIQNFRFGAAATQIFPLVASRLHMPIEAVMLIYSVGFIIYYLLCYILCGLVLKQYKYGLVLLLSSALFATDSFYWMQSELPQGLAFMVVVFAAISSKEIVRVNLLMLGLIFLGLITIAFFHPTIFIPFIFCILYLFSRPGLVQDKKLLYGSLFFFIGVLIVKQLFFSTEYDSQAAGGAGKAIQLFPHYFGLESNKVFLKHTLTKYYWIPVSVLALSIIYIVNRLWLPLAIFLSFFFGYLLLVNISYADGKAATFYIENLYLPLGIILALPIVLDIFPLLEKKKWLTPLLAIIILTGILRIYFTHDLYTARLNWERKFLDAHQSEKLIIEEKLVPMDTLLMSWGSSYEFWLLSTAEKQKTASIIIHANIPEVEYGKDSKNSFLTMWGSFPYQNLPAQYFKFTDTISSYTVIK